MGSKSAIGIGNGICFKQVRDKGGGSYIDPLVRDSIVGLWKSDQNINESPTRNIIKNTIKDKGGDLELLNFGYKLNSGYGKYEEDFTSWEYGLNVMVYHNKFTYTEDRTSPANIIYLKINKRAVNSFKIKVEGLPDGQILAYSYFKQENDNERTEFLMKQNGEYILPPSMTPSSTTEYRIGFYNTQYKGNIKGLTITQIPSFEGALVTDGKDDMIVSQKTVQEMLGGSNEITVVSMVHQIGLSSLTTINNIRSESVAHLVCRNICSSAGKTGIYGYSRQINANNPPALINNILGDKKDYTAEGNTALDPTDKFFVQGYKYSGSISEVSPIVYYWTFIANKVLTTDQINQVISYFNLDKHVKPDVYYDVKKQGLSNDTPEADWYLKDFSGNGHDMQLYNFAKKLGSGIGKYEVDFNTWIPQSYVADSTYTSNKLHITNIKGSNAILYTKKGANAMKVKITGIQSFNLVYRYIAENDVWEALEVDRDGIYELPASTTTTKTYYTGFTVPYYTGDCDITIEQIPDYEGALVSDAVDDYGQYVGDLELKDYTIAVDKAYPSFKVNGVPIISGIDTSAPFIFEFSNEIDRIVPFSYDTPTLLMQNYPIDRKITYQSSYVYNSSSITKGSNKITGSGLTIGRYGVDVQYANIALWSLLLFPYTLSEFLLERQLKKYKLGTLYPDMVEFRPIISGNIPYNAIEISQDPTTLYNKSINKTGIYLQEGSTVRVYIQPSGIDEVSKITINEVEYTDLPINRNGYYYADFPITKSPQKISYAIDEYIRYEDIVQPYPAIINLKQDGKTITWGDKLKVGSDIVFVESANLLPELYTVSETRYNGVTLYPNTIIKVEKSMVFDNARTYLKANEPNCILSPNRLRIPNSSYKILGYIPDISGHGNHGKLNNFAYAGMSGANGYVEDFTKWRISKSNIVSTISDSSIHFTHIGVNYKQTTAIFESRSTSNKKYNIKVRISGLTSNMRCFFNNTDEHSLQELVNGVNEISVDLMVGWYGFNINTLDGSVIGDCDITIQQIGEHEGSLCFDGVDDHIIIPTIKHGGKALLMKVNWRYKNNIAMVYDQRINWGGFGISISRDQLPLVAYKPYNKVTYIDGIKNESVLVQDLEGITHNITGIYDNLDLSDERDVCISRTSDASNSGFADMSMYEFMLFPDVPNEEEIKELNDIVGIEGGYVESPNYYYDVYGKKNTDTDRNLIADQVSKDVANALEVNNVGYNSESGYTDDNGLLLDGVDDYAVNTVIPAVTDFTVIAKRISQASTNDTMFITKGQDEVVANSALGLEYRNINGEYVYSFGTNTNVESIPDLITYCTPTNYNGKVLTRGNVQDTNGIQIGKFDIKYWKGIFYKLMFYTKTIDQLSINMLKNLFERDELIDITNPIFKKKEL